jgi:carotenoid cleavage dioxygenase
MNIKVVREYASTLPPSDDHPYRTGAWRPQRVEYDATDLEVIGELPTDLEGVYLRNTENPLHPAFERYHPFDGDGMVHAIHFSKGKASYRNRFVKTAGFIAEQQAGRTLWAGILERPELSVHDGWGARTRMKDASSTDVVVHRGMALTTFYQCGDAYQLDPVTLEERGKATWNGQFPADWGISAHPKVDELTGELLFFSYSKQAPYMSYGVVDPSGQVVHKVAIPLPGPRLPHDMAFTERYAILNDCPVFWDPALLARNIHRARFYRELPTRFAIIPRRGSSEEIRWFEASPTYVLHWTNAYEEGDEIVLEGFHQGCPLPEHRPGDGPWSAMMRGVDLWELKARAHRWRFNLRTGKTHEEFLDDQYSEFPTINGRYGGRRHRYTYAVTSEPGWFLFNGLIRYDHQSGTQQRYSFPKGVYASESPMAPRVGATAEDDGYLVTFVSDLPNDRSECQVFDARDVGRGPIARLRLPERICSGTHACWAPGSALAARA